MIILILIGLSVGLLSGFFGIGGGTILIPLLLATGYDIKIAVGISVVQMLFSSIFGSYINHKKGTLDIKMVLSIGFGGFIGALFSGLITSNVDDFTLEIIFLTFAIFALLRLFFKTKEHKSEKKVKKSVLFLIGFPIGAMSMSIGVGGSIILVPILVGFLNVSLKKATSSGLFFVVFSSIAGFISHYFNDVIDYKSGIIIGLASMIGVYVGIFVKDKVEHNFQRKLLVLFYMMIVIYLGQRIFL